MTKEERKEIMLEIKARKELKKRLQNPLKLVTAAAKKEIDKRQQQVEKNREFKTYEDAQEAYGYGLITEQEFSDIAKALEDGEEYVVNTTTPVEIAKNILREFVGRLEREIRDFEFEMLPPEEQVRIMQEAEERKQKREKQTW